MDKKRLNNPPVGLVKPETDPPTPTRKTYEYDPHLEPQLVWAGKKERPSFEVPTVSLHVHERIDPRTVIEAIRKRNGQPVQASLFERPEEKLPLRDAIDFYRHAHGWSNRLIAGDSLLVMNSLLEKEGVAGQVQMVYIDPPYGIKYKSNFQPFVNKRDVSGSDRDEDLTQEPEMIRAFRDTWELGIHSYLAYLRDRLVVARDLLTETGSVFVQIGDENVHLVRCVLDEVFGSENAIVTIKFYKTTSQTSEFLPSTTDFLIWYAKDKDAAKYRPLFTDKDLKSAIASGYAYCELADGTRRALSADEAKNPELIPTGARVFALDNLTSQSGGESTQFEYEFNGKRFRPASGGWKTNLHGMAMLDKARRLGIRGNRLRFARFFGDFPVSPRSDTWMDLSMGGFVSEEKVYVVQTNVEVVERAILMTSDPGDLVLDPTCGSGTTLPSSGAAAG